MVMESTCCMDATYVTCTMYAARAYTVWIIMVYMSVCVHDFQTRGARFGGLRPEPQTSKKRGRVPKPTGQRSEASVEALTFGGAAWSSYTRLGSCSRGVVVPFG